MQSNKKAYLSGVWRRNTYSASLFLIYQRVFITNERSNLWDFSLAVTFKHYKSSPSALSAHRFLSLEEHLACPLLSTKVDRSSKELIAQMSSPLSAHDRASFALDSRNGIYLFDLRLP